MSFVRDLSGNNPIDLKYSPANRMAADLTAVLALTPLYPGEVVKALNTGRNYRALGGSSWGLIGPVTSLVAGTLPPPGVTIVKAAGQSDPASVSPVVFTVTFSQDVTGFTSGDITLSGTVGGAPIASVSGGPNIYSVTVTGMTTTGSVIANVLAGVATGPGGLNTAAPSAATVQWIVDTQRPSVTINKGSTQPDPTSASPIIFDIVFDEPVAGFIASDINVSSTAGTLVVNVSGGPTTYTAQVTGMSTDGNVTLSIPANVCQDLSGNLNFASTSTDNIVQWIQPVTPPVGVTQTYFYIAGQY